VRYYMWGVKWDGLLVLILVCVLLSSMVYYLYAYVFKFNQASMAMRITQGGDGETTTNTPATTTRSSLRRTTTTYYVYAHLALWSVVLYTLLLLSATAATAIIYIS
jgi:hypothetical protein